MTLQAVIALCAVCTLISSIIGVVIGNFFGAKIAIAKLETWMNIREGDIRALQRDVSVNRDDLLVHDVEIGQCMGGLSLSRVRRQMLR